MPSPVAKLTSTPLLWKSAVVKVVRPSLVSRGVTEVTVVSTHETAR